MNFQAATASLAAKRSTIAVAKPATVEASYDAAQTTPDNRRHWRWADGLSAKSANSPYVRKVIRDRARYELANDPLVEGIVATLGNDMVGFGPSLQLNSPDPEFNRVVKLQWERWAKAVRLWPKLRLARRNKAVDGEAFLLLVYDPTVKHPVKWNVAVIESDRIATPDMPWEDPRRTDGIVFDEYGNPIEYHVLRSHPGDQGAFVDAWTYDRVSARYVLHWFTPKRAGQLRAVSELAPSLGTFADLRRFSKAVLKKRECEASIHGFVKQQVSPDYDSSAGKSGMAPWMEFDVEMGTWMALPDGSEPVQFESNQSADPYQGYKREAISDGARPWGMSYNVAACNSGDSSFSSGKLDHRLYGRNMELEQDDATAIVVDPLFAFWVDVSRNSQFSVIPDDSAFDWEQTWDWPNLEDPDPAKTASADAADIDAGIVSITSVQMRRKLDPALEEQRMANERGINVAEYREALRRRMAREHADEAPQPVGGAVR